MKLSIVKSTATFVVLFNIFNGLALATGQGDKGKECHVRLSGAQIEREEDFHQNYLDLVEKDRMFCEELQKHPAEKYLSLRSQSKQLQKRGEEDFSFAPHKAILGRVVKDLEQRKTRKFGQKYLAELESAKQKALELLKNGDPPYKATVRYIFQVYLPTLDLILFERHPGLKGKTFHQDNAEHLLEKFLAKGPDLLLYFSFNWLGDDFFVDTRPALMNLIGINLTGLDDFSKPPYADKYPMSLTEFAYHDLGHAEFTTMRDLDYLESDDKPLMRVVEEWESTRLKIKRAYDQVAEESPKLASSMKLLLFELLRERGFQFSLTVLKQELETEKWVYVLRKKLAEEFYDYYGIDKELFDLLDEARQLLVNAVERYKEQAQLDWIKATGSANSNQRVSAQIIHTPRLKFSNGDPSEVRIYKDKKTELIVEEGTGNLRKTEIREMVSAQVVPTRVPVFTDDVVKKIEKLLSQRSVTYVSVKPDKKIMAVYENGTEVPLQDAKAYNYMVSQRKLEEIEIFEIRQVLGSAERGDKIHFTIRKPSLTMVGKIRLVKNLITGNYTAFVKENGVEEEKSFPLVELRVDPLRNSLGTYED